jgi:hypothetical protein
MFPGIARMTLADDCSFGIADESKSSFVGATGQSPFKMALSPFRLGDYLPTSIDYFG